METKTCYDLAREIIDNEIYDGGGASRIDWGWINYQKRTLPEKKLREICRDIVENSLLSNDLSPNKKGRVAGQIYAIIYR